MEKEDTVADDGHSQDHEPVGGSRREFLRELGAAIGVGLLADDIPFSSLAEAAARAPQSALPGRYRFHRVITVGDGTPGLDEVEEILPGVMINDRSELIFHARLSSGARAVYRMRIDRQPRPRAGRPTLIVQSGQVLDGGFEVERIAAGDTNGSGAFVTVIRGAKDTNAVYLQRPGGEIHRILGRADHTPGPDGRFTGSFGDVDLDEGGTILFVARFTIPRELHQGLFRATIAHPGRGRLLLRTGQLIPTSRAMVTGLGLVERRGDFFVQQVFGRRPRHRYRQDMRTEPSGFLLGRVDRGRKGARLLVGSPLLGLRRSAIRGAAVVGPRVDGHGTAATVVHRSGSQLQLHRHRRHGGHARLSRTGQGPGAGVRTISAPVFGPRGLLFYRVIRKRSMGLFAVRGGERRAILESGDRIGGERVKVFNTGWHTDQVDRHSRIAFQAELADGRTAIVIGVPD